MKHILPSLALLLLTAGCSKVPTAKELTKAVASHDDGAIVRAFHDAIYDRFSTMSEALPAIRAQLNNSDPFARLQAAKALYTAGDHAGFATLLELVNSQSPITHNEADLRIEAGLVLAKFREKQAATAVFDLYVRTSGGGLFEASATLGAKDTLSIMRKHGYVQSEYAVVRYASLCPPEFIPKIAETFLTGSTPALKNAAAYALARLTGERVYIEYLAHAAQPAIDAKPQVGLSYDDSSKALRYLGSIQQPLAREVLDHALESANPVAVQYAVVNLLFNQPGGSEKARALVLHQFRGVPLRFESWEAVLQIAAKLDDPDVRKAGEAFDQRTSERSWHRYGVERKDWPIYNWIDDEVVDFQGR